MNAPLAGDAAIQIKQNTKTMILENCLECMMTSFEGLDGVVCENVDELRIDRPTSGSQVSDVYSDQQAFGGSIEQLPVY
jgi:hypothetical protein